MRGRRKFDNVGMKSWVYVFGPTNKSAEHRACNVLAAASAIFSPYLLSSGGLAIITPASRIICRNYLI